jgi:O-antigen ligase/tetratricopeptide (TPR) repeat protein
MEGVLLAMVCLSPWAYGAVHPGFEFLLDAGLCLLLLLWGVRMLLERQLTWKKSPVALCLAGLFLLGIWQLTPLPRSALARLAPATARLYEQLLPGQPEVLPGGEPRPAVNPPAGSTLSLYPVATRQHLFRVLAVFLVFVVVLNNLGTPAALKRLATAVVINGFLLALLGLSQFFSSPRNTVYWTYPTLGHVFGPFINRNHFACYLNLCIGLGVGLLLTRRVASGSGHHRRTSSRAHRRRRSHFGTATVAFRPERPNFLLQLLHDPPTLWLCAALGLMVSSVAICRSRGGLLALFGGAVVSAVLGRAALGRALRLGPVLLVGAVAVGLTGWFGLELVTERFETLREGQALESRLPIWERTLHIARDFPVWGAGYGTFSYVEPVYRTGVRKNLTIDYEHAHNDYLELLSDGGGVELGLALLAAALVFWLGCRAVRLNRGRSAGGLALGALFAFTTLVIHSAGEFPTHIPAITLLVTVLGAYLCALGRTPKPAKVPQGASQPTETVPDDYRLRLWGAAPILGAVTALGLGLMLAVAGWKAHRVDRLMEAGSRDTTPDVGQRRKRIAYLASAVPLAPDDANLRYELASARARLLKDINLQGPAGGWLGDEHLTPALRDYLHARDACPLLAGAQLGLGAFATKLERGEPREAYLRRVKLLAPASAELWYLCGMEELEAERPDDAWASWRHSLALSEDYLPQILAASSTRLPPERFIETVLPDKPSALVTASLRLFPDAGAVEERRPLVQKALDLLAAQAEWEPEDFRVKAQAYKALDQPDEAVKAYQELLVREPFKVEWRLEFARYLFELHRLEEARRELTVLLTEEPDQGEGQELLRQVTRELLQEKWGGPLFPTERGKKAKGPPSPQNRGK